MFGRLSWLIFMLAVYSIYQGNPIYQGELA